MFYKLLALAGILALAVVVAACGPAGVQLPGSTTTPLPVETTAPGLPGTGGTSPLEPTATAGAMEPTATVSPLEPSATITVTGQSGAIDDAGSLVAALQAAGADVKLGDRLAEETFPGISGTFMDVNGTSVQVFEFPDEVSREAAAATISGNGYIIGTTQYEWIGQPNFWSAGRLIVLYLGNDQAMIDLLSSVLGQPITGAQGTPGAQPGSELPAAVQAAINQLSELSGVAATDVQVISFDQVDWTDSCLGLGGPAESCAAVITPGWRIVLSVDGQQYEFHTDLTGENIRQK